MRRISTQILLPLLAVAAQVYAQNITGSITGRVVDPSGAAVPNASVVAIGAAKKTTVTTVARAEGDFSLAGLSPGAYDITVEAPGFKRLETRNVELDAQDHLALGSLALELGTATESVQVSAEGSILQTESVERSQAIVGKQIENIEVNGRNPLDMAKLIPGVVSTANFSVGGVNGLANIFVNGNRDTSNQLTINGIGRYRHRRQRQPKCDGK